MDLSAKVLREVEFQSRLRGYDTDEVDEFLEKIAVAVDEMQEKMRQLAYRPNAQNDRSPRGRPTRTTTASGGLSCSRSEPQISPFVRPRSRLQRSWTLPGASPEATDRRAGERAAPHLRGRAQSQRRHCQARGQRDQVGDELRKLSNLLDTERERLAGSLRAALSVVEQTLSPPMEISELGLAPASSQAGVPDDIEAQINEDAAAAAPSIRLPTQVRTTTTAPRRTKAGGRTSLQFRRSRTQAERAGAPSRAHGGLGPER